MKYSSGAPGSVALLAAALGLSLNGPHRVQAAPQTATQTDTGVSVSILSPAARTTLGGDRPVEISAFYQSGGGNQITTLELYVDGAKAAQKILDVPETKGVVSFLVDASILTPGPHSVVVRATAADSEVASAKTSFVFEAPAALPVAPAVQEAPVISDRGANPPRLSIDRPSADGTVEGTVTLRVKATDPSGKPPFVSLFIDRQFKTLRNYAPYEFQWDTTTLPNGYHTVEVFGYNDAQDVGHAEPLRIYVNNPGGRTERRTDLMDAPKVKSKAVRKSAAPSKVKTADVPRRPALLAKSKPLATKRAAISKAKLAKVFTHAEQQMALVGLPGLSDPFFEASGTAPTTKMSATVKVMRSGPLATMGSFKPMAVAAPSEAILTVGPAVSHLKAAPHLLLANAAVADTLNVTKFAQSPSVPKVTIKTMSSVQVTHPNLRVSVAKMLATPRVAIHLPTLSKRTDWIKADGQKVLTFNTNRLPLERPLVAQNSVMFGPLRQIFQQGGGSLVWQARTGVITARTGTRDVSLTVGQKTATVNNAKVMLDAAPYINKGRTMVPLAFLKAAMNANVQYDPATGHLSIVSKQ